MKKALTVIALILLRASARSLVVALCFATASPVAYAQQEISESKKDNSVDRATELILFKLLAQSRPERRPQFALMPESGVLSANAPNVAAAGQAVQGGGTIGRLPKWTGFTSSNSFVGDSTIFEDKFGKVGIGTDTPTSKLTVAGMVEITLGGLKFPDGTVQTSSASGALFAVAHDTTLKGTGTVGSPLGAAVPLTLVGNSSGFTEQQAIFGGINNSDGIGVLGRSRLGSGVVGVSGDSSQVARCESSAPGAGVCAVGNNVAGASTVGGDGIRAFGGKGSLSGGLAMIAVGGGSDTGSGGSGILVAGGSGANFGGTGVTIQGGDSGFGGSGITSTGGNGSGGGGISGDGIFARAGLATGGATTGLAGDFSGDVEISGKLKVTSGIKMFHIDHPLDPENKYLNHSAIESLEVLNVYSGNVQLNENGEAVVILSRWFESLNRDFRYSLTPIGAPASSLYIAQEVADNQFKIAGGSPGMKVSWQVTGVRSDPTARKYKFDVEEEKPERERGYYLNPDAFNQPEEKAIGWARRPEMMRQLKQQRLDAEQKLKSRQP